MNNELKHLRKSNKYYKKKAENDNKFLKIKNVKKTTQLSVEAAQKLLRSFPLVELKIDLIKLVFKISFFQINKQLLRQIKNQL